MGAAREADQADFDLERFIDVFDEAMTSSDPRVIETLRKLMMIVALTKPESSLPTAHDRQRGPLRRLFEDMHHLNRRIYDIEENIRGLNRAYKHDAQRAEDYENYAIKSAAMNMASHIDQSVLSKLSQDIPSFSKHKNKL